MENKNCITEEIAQNKALSKYIRKLKLTLDIILLSVLGFIGFVVAYYYSLYGFESFPEEMFFLAVFVLMVLFLVCLGVSDSLDICYRYYRCTACGHIHKLSLTDKGNNAGAFLCPGCNQYTNQKKLPYKKESANNHVTAGEKL